MNGGAVRTTLLALRGALQVKDASGATGIQRYFLTVGKSGSKLRDGGEVWFNGLQFDASGKPTWPDGITMSQLASMLSSRTDRPVVDRTGLRGKYGMRLEFSLADGDDRPTVFTAVQEQLGLKLEPGRAPIEVLVIDHIETPTPNE